MSKFLFNNVGFIGCLGSSVIDVVVGPSPAIPFIQAAGITDATQKTAVTTLVSDLQNAGLWDKMIAIYPIVGGTQQAHVLNLKDPRDADAAYRLSLYADSSAITMHDKNGMQLHRTWANTFFNPRHNFNSGKGDHISVYVRYRDTVLEHGDLTDMGAYQGGYHYLISSCDPAASGKALAEYHSGYTLFNSATQGMGYYVLSGMGENAQGTLYENGTSMGVVTDATGAAPDIPFYIGTINLNTSPYVTSNRQYTFSTIGDYLNPAENMTLYNIIQHFQDTLGRKI